MKFLCACILIGLIGCSTAKINPKPRSPVAQKLLTLPKLPADTNYVRPRMEFVLPFKVNVDAQRYCWTLESSTNLVDWSEEIVPVVPYLGSFCLSGDPTVFATNAFKFFRLHGVQLF